MDSRAAGVEDNGALRKDDDLKPRVSLDKQDIHALRGSNWNMGNCLHCQKDFKKKTTWQKYCTDVCRATAYELRTGKKLRIAAKVKA